MNQTKQENSQLTGISLHPETKVWKDLEAEPIYTLYKTIYRDISQAFVLNMSWILLSNETNFKDQNWSARKWVILPSLSPARKNVKWESYYLLSEIGPRPQFDTGSLHKHRRWQDPGDCLTATCWEGAPSGACLCTLPVAAQLTHRSFALTWSSFIFSAAKIAWMPLSPSLKIANLTESAGHRDLHLSLNVSVTHKWIESKFNS